MFLILHSWLSVLLICSLALSSFSAAQNFAPEEKKIDRKAVLGGAIGGGIGGVIDGFFGKQYDNQTLGLSVLGATIGGGVGGYKDGGNVGVLGSAVGAGIGVEIFSLFCLLATVVVTALGGAVGGGLGLLGPSIGIGAGAAEGLSWGGTIADAALIGNAGLSMVTRGILGAVGGAMGAFYGSDFYL